MPATILVFNAGSSSIKATLYRMPAEPLPARPPEPLWEAQTTWRRGASRASLKVRTSSGTSESEVGIGVPADALEPMLASLWGGSGAPLKSAASIDAAGHRVVHGGDAFREPARIDDEVRSKIASLAEIAPEHNSLAAAVMDRTRQMLGPQTPEFAVFDTAFHATLPEAAYTYGGPYEWRERGIRRYGFHGLSHRYASRRAAGMLGREVNAVNLITCHLGNGCSLAAIRGGRSVDTTMGFTPLEGLMMGSRCGSIDPAIVIHLLRKDHLDSEALDQLLNRESGLKGLSGISTDMRDILAARARGEKRSALAFDCFIQQLCRCMGAMLASVGTPHALVFTGGIGEHAAEVREAACTRFEFLGVRLDALRNASEKPDADLTAAGAQVRVLVVEAEEDWEIAKDVVTALGEGEY